jgi:hypothetical protein
MTPWECHGAATNKKKNGTGKKDEEKERVDS